MRYCIAAVLGLLVSACRAELTEPSCQEVQQWVTSHRDELPTTLESFEAFPATYRRAILSEMPADAWAKVWREHLSRFLSQHGELSAPQRTFIEQVASGLDSIRSWRGNDVRVDELEARAVALLGRNLTREAFAGLTAADPAALYGSDNPDATSYPECECNSEHNLCAINFSCDLGAACEITWFGCGFLGFRLCDGACVWNGL